MIVVGHCLATAEQLDNAFETMLLADDIRHAAWQGLRTATGGILTPPPDF